MVMVRALVGLLVIAGFVLLQVFLSKQESKVPGLILPALSFLFALMTPLMMMVPPDGVSAGFIFQMILVFLMANIPTAILIAIYFACRRSRSRNKQIDKMNIQDLD